MTRTNRRRENAVRNLVNLYTVVIGVALSLAVVTLIDAQKGLRSVTITSAMLFVAFVVTLLPFYHGALRHMDDVYIESDASKVRDGVLVFDFALLFLHALAFVVLSLLLSKPSDFAWLLVVLLAIDVVWGIFASYSRPASDGDTTEGRWAIINAVFVIGMSIYLVSNEIWLDHPSGAIGVPAILALACVLRTVVDYVWCRQFYFPR